MPYEKYVRAEILAKLHMDASTFEFSQVPADKRAVGYRLQPDGTYSRGTAAAARRLRVRGWFAHHGHGSRQIRRVSSFGVAGARRRGNRPGAPQLRCAK